MNIEYSISTNSKRGTRSVNVGFGFVAMNDAGICEMPKSKTEIPVEIRVPEKR